MTDDQHGEGTPRGGSRWDPLPQGEYDDGATAFVELPEGGVDALLAADSPLAAPGHGYVPPQITVGPATTAGTDPAATGAWPAPGAPVDGAQWHDPNAAHQQHGTHRQHGPEHGTHQQGHDVPEQSYGGPGAPYDPQVPYGSDATARQHGGDDRFTYDSGVTGQWNFEETAAAAEAAPGHDVTGQWSIPVAGGDLPDESGEFTTSSLVEQWGGTPPATLPGGAPAPWATQAAGRPWGQQDPAGPEEPHPGHPHEPGPGHDPGQAHGPEHDPGQAHGQRTDVGPAAPSAYASEEPGAAGHTADPSGFAGHRPEPEYDHGPGPAEHAHGAQRADHEQGTEPARYDRGAEPAEYDRRAEPAEYDHRPEQRADFAAHGPEQPEYAAPGPEQPEAPGHAPEPAEYADHAPESTEYAGHAPEPAEYADHAPESAEGPGHGTEPSGLAGHPPPAAHAPEQPHYGEAPGEFPGEPLPGDRPEAAALPQDAPDASQAAPGDGEDSADAAGAPEAADGPSEPVGGPLPSEAEADADTDAAHAQETPDGGARGEGDRAPDEDPAVHPSGTPETAAGTAPQEEHPLASYVLRVNGTDRPVGDAWIGESLLYVLRERLGLAGAKDGCSQGECGACNVQVDGRLVASCLVPAVTAAGSEVRTVEGLAEDGRPSDVQRALARCGAVQCGFCIPGMAMTVHDLLEGNPAPTELETRQALCGNLCRCSGYRGVVDAVKEVVAERETHSAPGDGDTDEARIPHQAGPGAGGVNPSAFGAPPEPHTHGPHSHGPHTHGPHSPEAHDQPYGQDGGPA
ncbi:2Fe-2S iron-sulfur cluster-binding protein [Streptomyces sp. NPDC059696]|uniref:2Fe-2S iron-sulfur cluster-binding protein n=1 Tax=Streptomyces sp. NPDC059696 TaxID=3346911 RepID=UPI00367DFF97